MSHQETVKIKIKKDGSGQMSFDLDGFVGDGCNILKDVEAALGMVSQTEDKAEMHQYEDPDLCYNELHK